MPNTPDSVFQLTSPSKQVFIFTDSLDSFVAKEVALLDRREVRVSVAGGKQTAYDTTANSYNPPFTTKITVQLPPQIPEANPYLGMLQSTVQRIITKLSGRYAVWNSSSEILNSKAKQGAA